MVYTSNFVPPIVGEALSLPHPRIFGSTQINTHAPIGVANLATRWHEVPLPPLEGEVPNEREAEGFARQQSAKPPQSARSGCQLPFQGSQGGYAATGG